MKGFFLHIIMGLKINVYIKQDYGYLITEKDETSIIEGLFDTYNPSTTESEN